MRQMLTDYGMRAAFELANTAASSPFEADAVDAMMDELLLHLPEDHEINADFEFPFQGKTITVKDTIKAMQTQLPRLRVDAISRFEKYFQGGTDLEKIIGDYSGGHNETRRTLRHMGIFLLEAISVRSELLFPSLMSMNAGQAEDVGTGYMRFAGMIEDYVVMQVRGPHLPPLSPARTITHLRQYIPELDFEMRSVLAGNERLPEPSAFN